MYRCRRSSAVSVGTTCAPYIQHAQHNQISSARTAAGMGLRGSESKEGCNKGYDFHCISSQGIGCEETLVWCDRISILYVAAWIRETIQHQSSGTPNQASVDGYISDNTPRSHADTKAVWPRENVNLFWCTLQPLCSLHSRGTKSIQLWLQQQEEIWFICQALHVDLTARTALNSLPWARTAAGMGLRGRESKENHDKGYNFHSVSSQGMGYHSEENR